MKTAHAIQRAYERYNILNFSVSTVLSDILNGRCIQTNEDLTKFSRTFVRFYCIASTGSVCTATQTDVTSFFSVLFSLIPHTIKRRCIFPKLIIYGGRLMGITNSNKQIDTTQITRAIPSLSLTRASKSTAGLW